MNSGVCFVSDAGLPGAAAGESAMFCSILQFVNCRLAFRGWDIWELPNYLEVSDVGICRTGADGWVDRLGQPSCWEKVVAGRKKRRERVFPFQLFWRIALLSSNTLILAATHSPSGIFSLFWAPELSHLTKYRATVCLSGDFFFPQHASIGSHCRARRPRQPWGAEDSQPVAEHMSQGGGRCVQRSHFVTFQQPNRQPRHPPPENLPQ